MGGFIVDKNNTEQESYKLVSREYQRHNTQIAVKENIIGSKQFHVIAGPCAVESKGQLLETAWAVKEAGATLLRGGAFKPRSSPYSFQGLGEKGLKYLAEAREETGLPVVTEVMDVRDVELVASYVDIIQVGARNMQNFFLLREISKLDKPVILKRGQCATLKEWLMAAEYFLYGGNSKVILCERGIRTFEDYTRNTLDLSAVPALKNLSHLPVFVDPSHGTGKWELVAPMALAALAAGADGLLIEVHPNPENACSDGQQSLNLKNFALLMEDLRRLAPVLAREMVEQIE
jgi:3-deoxy-7-phosphoheptulonate synthase